MVNESPRPRGDLPQTHPCEAIIADLRALIASSIARGVPGLCRRLTHTSTYAGQAAGCLVDDLDVAYRVTVEPVRQPLGAGDWRRSLTVLSPDGPDLVAVIAPGQALAWQVGGFGKRHSTSDLLAYLKQTWPRHPRVEEAAELIRTVQADVTGGGVR